MGEALIVTSGKGGAGKSTVAVNLAAAMARLGDRVVLVDADTGLRSLDVMLGLENDVVYDLTDVAEGVCRLRQAVLRCRAVDGLYMVAAAQLRDVSSVTRGQMEDIAGQLKRQYDAVVIDCPAGVDTGFHIAAAGADRAVIVTQNDVISVRDAERVKGLLQRADVTRAALLVNRALPEKLRRREKSACEALAERLELPLIGIVGENDAFSAAAQKGRPAVLDDEALAGTFEEIARRIRGEEIPVRPIRRPGFWTRLLKG